MRPTSEIHSALDLLDSELARQPNDSYQLARDVLAWVTGERVPWDGPNAWLAACLLGDPPKITDVPPGAN